MINNNKSNDHNNNHTVIVIMITNSDTLYSIHHNTHHPPNCVYSIPCSTSWGAREDGRSNDADDELTQHLADIKKKKQMLPEFIAIKCNKSNISYKYHSTTLRNI